MAADTSSRYVCPRLCSATGILWSRANVDRCRRPGRPLSGADGRRRAGNDLGRARRRSWRTRPAASYQTAAWRGTRTSAAVSRWFICFPDLFPTDEVVSLKMFHREDEPLDGLFLDDEQKSRIDHLWERASLHQPASRGREQLPAAIHRLRDAGSAEGAGRFLRRSTAGLQETGR